MPCWAEESTTCYLENSKLAPDEYLKNWTRRRDLQDFSVLGVFLPVMAFDAGNRSATQIMGAKGGRNFTQY